jgi:hypothetical protein
MIALFGWMGFWKVSEIEGPLLYGHKNVQVSLAESDGDWRSAKYALRK